MVLYIIFFLIVISINYIAEKNGYRRQPILAFSFLLMAFFVGFSDMLGGYDRYIYGELFDNIADITNEKGRYEDASLFALYSTEIGYGFYNILLSHLTSNRYIFILLITITIYILFFFVFKKYCVNYSFALMLFMGLMFFFTFTYLRQMVAVGLGWLSFQYIYKRKLLKFLACVLIAATFHNSAIILLPLYFIPIKRFDKKKVMLFMILCLLIGLSGGPSAIFRIYGDVADMHNRSDSYIEEEIGFKYEYIIEAFVFLYIVFKNYRYIPITKKDTVMLNALLGFCAILLLFVQSLNGGRLGWFYMIGVIVTLSTICNGLKEKSQTRVLVLLMSFILFTRIVFQWGYMLSPYKTFFSNGIRDYDPIYEKYEYDENYKVDKFYRK
ncbi:EpsG family protein [Prevotella denticola]|uniref:EpsG family protein n=1 Tax=Prevotella denticola TaxID=28129 RepID=A0A379E3Z5_9BACT|nr:EpsG family protein [Prevotella denticola]SUB87051.1 Uncharacterised protein [Prevotella denticola]